jgi:CotH kinase protein/Lamin Tail Domain/Secretion system C-terminal sorting domain
MKVCHLSSMKRISLYFLFCLVVLNCTQPQAQTVTDSNLPIIIINTDGGGFIPDEPKILGTMKIIYAGPGQRNLMSYQNDITKLNYNGRIGIEVRGSSSQFLDKKQYGLTTLGADNVSNNNVSLLSMPAENDWILSGLAFDASYMRDYMAFTLSRKIGQYAPRTQHCELIINGDYRGIYMLVEKIKVDDSRVDIVKIKSTDNEQPDVSGGYIIKADKIAGVDQTAWKMDGTDFVYESPKSTDISSTQKTYIQSIFWSLSNKSWDESITYGFPTVIDVRSFVDFMLINELGSNADAYQFSTYFHKDKNAKLRAGPIWDSNLTYGYDLIHWGLSRSFSNVWQFNNGDNIGPQFWRNLFGNPTFKCTMAKRWNELTQPGQPLSQESLFALVDETATNLSEASAREHVKWDAGIYTPLYTNWGLDHSLTGQVNFIKSFITQRLNWMTTNLGSFSACNNLMAPPLVITRINYQPATSSSFPESDDQEFIEITNTGEQDETLTGYHFSGTGFVYQFHAGIVLPAHSAIQLANKSSIFFDLHGYSPFGEFTRNLSNSGQKLTLADAYGNVIDEVEYSTQLPWPSAAGNGSYLKLTNINLNNNDGANWIATTESISSTVVGLEEPTEELQLFPNPTMGTLKITAKEIIKHATILDAHGRQVESFKPNVASTTLNITHYPSGVYTLIVQIGGKKLTRRVIKR